MNLQELKKKINSWIESESFSIFFALSFFTIFAFLIIFRLYNLQIINGEKYHQKVVKNSLRYKNNKVFDRGKIFFKNKDENIIAAMQENRYSLIVNNKNDLFLKNNNKEEVFQKLSKIIKIEKKRFLKIVSQHNDPYEVVKNKITEEEKEKIKKLKIKGFYFIQESIRVYPLAEVGSKIIGFLDINNNGVGGLEKYYNKILKRDFKKEKKNIFYDIFTKPFKDFFAKKEIKREGDLYTSIDINVQRELEKKLNEITKKFSSKKSFGVIAKPASGEILALSDGDLIDFNKTKKDYRNELVEFQYEPGSILKPLVVAMALDSNAINTNFSYNDTGCIKVQKYKVCNYDKRARGPNIGLVQVIKESLNLGMVAIERRMKNSDFLNYFLKFGLSEETGIDLPNENNPTNISSLDYSVPIDYATASFGQGVSFSPMVMLRALSVISNDGYLVTPHIVKRIDYGALIPEEEFDNKKKRVLSEDTIDKIKKIMVQAVYESKSKSKFRRKGYSVAAKTGTAQIASKYGGYKKGVNIHAFYGYFPAYAKPEDRYIILLYTLEPRAKYSSQTLTKPFFDLVDFLISYYNIAPDKIEK